MCILLIFCKASCETSLRRLLTARCAGFQMCQCKACRHQKNYHSKPPPEHHLHVFQRETGWTFPVITVLQHPFNESASTGLSRQRIKALYFLLLGVAHVPGIPRSPAVLMGDRAGLYSGIKWEKAESAKPSRGVVGKICGRKLEMLEEGQRPNLGIRGNRSW